LSKAEEAKRRRTLVVTERGRLLWAGCLAKAAGFHQEMHSFTGNTARSRRVRTPTSLFLLLIFYLLLAELKE
jgi:hypothetical protein